MIGENNPLESANEITLIPKMALEERHKILVEWNQTARDYLQDRCVHHLFEEQVRRTPDAIAALSAGKSLTYSDLNTQSNQLARELKGLGVGPEVLVGVCVDRSLAMLVALFGILKAGGAYVPLDPNYPFERLNFIADDSQIRVLVTQREIVSNRLSLVQDIPVLFIEDNRTHLDDTDLDCDSSTTQLAYLIYTSGSTGRPKGVAIEHRNAVSFLYWIRETFADEELAGVLGATSICFDLSVFELFGPLSWGGKVILVDQALDLIACESREEVTLLNTVPSVAAALLKARALPNSVITVNLAGEPLSPALVDSLYDHPSVRAVNDLYGPSETTTYSTWARREPRQPATIGRPIANTQVYVLDERLNPVPLGSAGDLWIGGAGVARGYWKRPDLTAERFLTNPFMPEDGGRIYRTGDLARWRPDGQLEYLGRSDHQVKIRGFRVELGEVESTLDEIDGITESAVVARGKSSQAEAENNELMLVAFVVPEIGTTLSASAIRSRLAMKLPDYMVPSQFIVVHAFPLTTNGKLDRKALMTSPIDVIGGIELIETNIYVPPINHRERLIAEVWQSVLGLERVGRNDKFLDLGGHSLKAIVIASQISEQYGHTVPFRWVFEYPTVEKLARQLDCTTDRLETNRPIRPLDRKIPLQASFGQQALWLVHSILADSATYNAPVAFRISGPVDRQTLSLALAGMISRHESLRLALVQNNGTLIQQVFDSKDLPVPWRELSLRRDSSSARESILKERLLEEIRRPFDLGLAPLWRVLLIDLADDDHAFVVTFHHSIVDEWSFRLFTHELETLYSFQGDLKRANLPLLPVQYADYAQWQRQKLSGQDRERLLAYWTEQLTDLPPALQLPSDRIRPLQPTGQGGVHEFRLDQSIVPGIRHLAREQETTLFTVLLTSFQVWLHRFTGQSDLIVGTPLADRNRPEVQSLIGYFLNTLPIRSKLESETTFLQVLHQVHQTTWNAFSHADLPFEQMVELAVKQREPGIHPIYQVMFVLLEEPLNELKLGTATGVPIDAHTSTSKNDLTLDIQATGDEWVCRLEYATDLFSQTLAERFAVNFQSLLKEIAKKPEAPIQYFPLMSHIETQQVLKDWNQTSVRFSDVRTIHEFFERQVELTPESNAIVFNNMRMSYRQLNERANALANRLINLGTKPDSLIGLFAERSIETLVGLLGILKAGAAYVPLDPSYPEARLRSIINDARIEVVVVVVVTQDHLADQLTEGNFHRVIVGASGSDELSIVQNPPHTAGPSNLAYVLYTSGSTGRPKGVAMEHRALTNLIQWQIEQYSSGKHFRTLQFASLGFDVSFQEIFSTWCSGGTLVLIDENTRRDMSLFFKYIESEQVERIFVPFVVLQQFIEASEDHLQKASSLREVVTAGEQLRITPQLVKFFENNPDCRLVNQYGPTEAHVVTSYTLEGPPQNWPLLPPIGRPIANIQVYVLDTHRQPLPVGMPGELYLAGVGVARGYLNQPELTAEKFLPDPFNNNAGSRLYRTGDKVRWNADGQLEFLGRIDQQVKFRGFRIELGEIEAVLNHAPQVTQALVMLREDQPGEKRLVAYVVPTEPTAVPSADELRGFLKNQLPEYMIPSIFVVIPNLPLTVNGKVDRRALPIPNYELSGGKRHHIAPRTPLEQILADSWKSVLGIERISVDDNFFELGGHSLLAMRLASTVGKQLNREVLVKWVFENPTVEQLSQKLIGIQGDNRPLQPISLVDRSQPLPLSFGQHSMWLVQALLPDSATYNQPIAIRLTGRIDRAVVTQAIEQIARRHESLRTAFVQSGETLVQHICKPAEFAVNRREISLHQPTTERQHQALQATLLDEVRQPFDLAVAPLWRVLWIELADDDRVLVLTFHHSIIDEWSMRIFCSELSALYRTAGNFQAASLPELPIQYADYAAWQQARLATAEWEQSIAYWKVQLADLPAALDLPTDKVRPIQLSGEGAIHEFRLSEPLTRKIRQLARDESVTLFTTMLAVFHVWLVRHTGQTDLIVGTPLANRERPEVQSLIGYFLNTIPIRARLEGKLDFRSVLRQIHQTFRDACTHVEIPFERLVELTVKERELGRHPVYQVMFVLLEESLDELRLGDAISRPLWVDTGTSKNDLTLDIQVTGNEWICRFEYETDLFNQPQIERFAVHFVELLNSIVKDPDTQIGRLNICDIDERRQIIHGWNEIAAALPEKLSTIRLFEEQAHRTPNAIALSYGNESLSYSQLNSLANRLAKQLVENHIEIESRVGICVERSLDMVVGIIAILKAGAAYVPLDPRYPHDRLAYMIQDAGIKVLICDLTTMPMFSNWPSRLSIINPSRDVTDIDFSSTEVSSDNAAYVIYTSGSTGQPKGCVVTHGNVVRLFQTTESLLDFNETDVWTLFHSFAFDFSVWEIWGALFYGGRLVVVPYDVSRSPDEFLDLLIHEGVTVLNQTPSAFRQLIEAENSRVDQTNSPQLRYVIFGGEGLDPRLLRSWVQRHGIDRPQLINMYGITETTVHVTYRRITAEDVERGGSPIGRPLADLQVYLLNPEGEPVPVGVPGEIYVGGAGLARGYLNRPELTTARFVTPPFDGCPSDRLYRSGDLARWNDDGSLDFLGRIDNQVKIRGHRVELGEIEAAIHQLESFAQAAVVARDNGPVGNVLVAYLVPQPGAQLDVANVRQALQLKLPSYMVPSFYIALETLPLTINGKLDIKALPLPQSPSLNRERSIVLPRNRVEEIIASAWSRVLNLQPISVDDNFFELGGHSLLAVRVVDAIKSSSEITIKVADLFRHATVAELARSLSDPVISSNVSNRDQYLESIRPGKGSTHLVIVGAKLRVPLEVLPPEIPVWWLKLDGLHVWPPKHLDLKTQAEIHAQELSNAIPSGTILLCGHSYGGVLAIGIAQQLMQLEKHDIKLILLEPPLWSTRQEPIIKKVKRKLKEFKNRDHLRNVREVSRAFYKSTIGRVKNLIISARTPSDQEIAIDDRWVYMEPFLKQNAGAFQLPDTTALDVHLIKTRYYDKVSFERLKQSAKHSLHIHSTPEHLDHYEMADPQNSMVWMDIVLQLIDHDARHHPSSTSGQR